MIIRGILSVVFIVVFINLIWVLPLLEQWNIHDIINDKVFRKVKIKGKIRFFFKAIGGQSVSRYGIIKALLFLQVKGYILSLCSIITMITLWFITKEFLLCYYVMGCILVFAVLLDGIVLFALMIISRRRSSDK